MTSRLVLTDIVQQRLLDIKPNNHKRTVVKYLKSLDPSICFCVTMDFAPGYAKAVEQVLPEALIVIDKFHVVQEVNRCLDNVRKVIEEAGMELTDEEMEQVAGGKSGVWDRANNGKGVLI